MAGLSGCSPGKGPPHVAAKPEVGVVTLHAKATPIFTQLPGRVSAYRIAEIRPQVGGVIQKLLFTEGQNVLAGQQLYQIDPALFEASLATAEATEERAVASTAAAQVIVDRYRPLAGNQVISTQTFDNAVTTLNQDTADVASGKAAVETAKINLAYARVISPIPGRTGRSSVTEGALVATGQTTSLVTVTQLNPVYVDVTQSSDMLLRLKRELASGQIRGVADNVAPVKLTLDDGTAYDPSGKMEFSEVTVDQASGSVVLRAIFPNDKGQLLPGMFVEETIEEGIRENAILAPQRGVTHDPKGDATALVLGTDGKVVKREVVTDRAIGNDWLILSGLGDGDRLVVDSLQTIKPGDEATAKEVPAEIGAAAPSTKP
jgi:membrane fusion protein (multidrug efflux system)